MSHAASSNASVAPCLGRDHDDDAFAGVRAQAVADERRNAAIRLRPVKHRAADLHDGDADEAACQSPARGSSERRNPAADETPPARRSRRVPLGRPGQCALRSHRRCTGEGAVRRMKTPKRANRSGDLDPARQPIGRERDEPLGSGATHGTLCQSWPRAAARRSTASRHVVEHRRRRHLRTGTRTAEHDSPPRRHQARSAFSASSTEASRCASEARTPGRRTR